MPDNEFIPASLRIGRIGATAAPRPEVPFDVLLRGINSSYEEWLNNQSTWDHRDTRDLIITMKVALERMQQERDEALVAYTRFMEKMADILNDEANAEIEQLRKERDEARRKICEMEAECIVHPPCSPQQYAVRMGWDCFPDKAEADENNTLFRTTDGE